MNVNLVATGSAAVSDDRQHLLHILHQLSNSDDFTQHCLLVYSALQSTVGPRAAFETQLLYQVLHVLAHSVETSVPSLHTF